MINLIWRPACRRFIKFFAIVITSASIHPALSQANEAAVIQGIDGSVASRDGNIASYTVTEHYSVFRNQDKNPAAEMFVQTTYQRDQGKSFTILSQSGSDLILKQVLGRILDSEKILTQPANRAAALITSANYTMRVKGSEAIEGRNCLALAIDPRRVSPYLFQGNLWVDASDYSIVQISGVASRSVSVLTGPAQITRRYATIDGFPMATHATAVSSSWLLGQTTVEIDYSGYQIQRRATN